jgi:hypothetical protein
VQEGWLVLGHEVHKLVQNVHFLNYMLSVKLELQQYKYNVSINSTGRCLLDTLIHAHKRLKLKISNNMKYTANPQGKSYITFTY